MVIPPAADTACIVFCVGLPVGLSNIEIIIPNKIPERFGMTISLDQSSDIGRLHL